MKSSRTSLILVYNKRIEVEKGVYENSLSEKTVKAEEEQVFQARRDKAMAEGYVITARFIVRDGLKEDNLDYAIWKGKKYKVNSMNAMVDKHFMIIELGELI